ncbi:uncharacterized protein [Halyomorpha halys]|uniref:uncharacterized protein n=1 Tax=Halyomorpha halys TaxID=286706 RepID=UPI0034D21274
MSVHLIEEVSRWPILYNTSCKDYKNVQMKNRVWSDITSKLFGNSNLIIVEKVKNKWKNLRDTFVKHLRKDKPNSKQWKHEEKMRFLLPHIKTKVPITHYNEESLDLSLEKRGSSPSPEELRSENLCEVHLKKTEENSKKDIELPVEAVMEESPSRRQANNPKSRRRDSFDSLMAAGVHFMDNSAHLLEQVPFSHHNQESLELSIEKRSSSFSQEELPSENSWEVNLIKKIDIEMPVETVMEESPSRRQANNPKRRRRRDSFNSLMAAGVHFMDNSAHLLEQFSCYPLPFDSVDYFFLAVASSVKRMRPTNQINLKRAILDLILDIESNEVEDSKNVASSPS